jgi:Protein of unknown function (DUF1360)
MAQDSVRPRQSWWRRQGAAYRNGQDRPLAGYLGLVGVYAVATGGASGLAKALGRSQPDGLSPWEVTQLALATQRLARLMSKDPVTSPLRAPFTEYRGTSAPGELAEEVRGDGARHAMGELLTCPMCLGQWIATGFAVGLALAPKLTRMAMGTFAGIAGADFLQHAYVRLQQATE